MIDLHLHLDGSLPLYLVKKLAKKQNIDLQVENDKELEGKLCVPKDCSSLNDYIKSFDYPLELLQTKQAISETVYELQEYLKKQGLIYAEIRFAPQLHLKKGLTQEEVVMAAIDGLNRSDFKANLILCCMRNDSNKEENIQTVKIAKKYLGKGVCAIDLAGAEALYKTSEFDYAFNLAKKLNIPFTIHAGEADGPQSVKTALDFGAKRIGHGIHCVQDENVLKEVIEKQIPLEICPTSNFQTKTMATYEDYPVRKLFDKGVKITINTDNMTVSNTSIYDEYKFLKQNFGFTNKDIIKTINNAIDVAFISEKEKEELRQLLKKKLCSSEIFNEK